ncbi:hypothetical protein F0562_015769 [Nyssa sinensis]|uniref:Uncharacterized protein n=1 Tax=Nyssa sinensis TaxID=561372 RepID=A0A5J4ZL62_9ASTE|nr:hypothetical protein F0562_015769 [Nyssa sinensis]
MEHKAFLRLLVLFLFLSFVLSTAAVPTSRSLKSIEEDPTAQDFLAQGVMDMKTDGELLERQFIEGRMDLESNDYPGTGANNHHDPKTPGRV